MHLTALRQQLAAVIEADKPTGDALPSGIPPLDRLLNGGGLPRGRLTEIVGPRGSGKTTLVRRLVEAAIGRKQWVAYVDATRTLAPRDWAHLDLPGPRDGGLWMVRPHDAARGAWCADVLLRSGAFPLVVLDGAPALSRPVAVRLTRLARDAGAALVILSDATRGTLVGSALRLRVEKTTPSRGGGGPRTRPAGTRWRRSPGGAGATDGTLWPAHAGPRRERGFVVAVEKGGIHQSMEVGCAIGVARRLCADSEIPDRRGVERGGTKRGGESRAPTAPGREPAVAAAQRVLARHRRCAEAVLGTDVLRHAITG